MKKTETYLNICAWLCAGLMLVLLVLQFLPYWSGNGDSTSVNGYVWRITEHTGLQEWFAGQIPGYDILQTIAMPILQLVLAALGVLIFLVKRSEWAAALFAGACGIVGIWGNLTGPEFQLGSLWGAFLALSLIMTMAAAFVVVLKLMNRKR